MRISAVSSMPLFRGIEAKNDKSKVNFAINGGGSGIGKNMTRQYFLAHFAPEGVYSNWDRLKEIYNPELNLVEINLGSMGMKGEQKLADMSDEKILTQMKHGNILGTIPDSIKLSILRKGEKTENADNREVFLQVASKNAPTETVKLVGTRDKIDWTEHDAKIVVDTTGANTNTQKLQAMKGEVPYGILSAPPKGDKDMVVVVAGVNNDQIKYIDEKGGVISAASCTTTCIAPYIKLFNDVFGIESGMIETTHAATGTQSVTDKAKFDPQSKNRGALDCMIPTTTGAAKAIGRVVKNDDGSTIPLDGTATRVPTAAGSMAILNLNLKENVTEEQVKEMLAKAQNDPKYKNLIASAPIASTSRDVVGNITSGLFVPESIKIVNGNLLSIKVYYDNEFGYTRSLATLTQNVAKHYMNNNQKTEVPKLTFSV